MARKSFPVVRRFKERQGLTAPVYGRERIAHVEANVAVVREHFGTNITDAVQISLQLTADAIRAGRLSL